nr:hypothetical protein [Oscillospiraceae bacterium]
MKNFVKILLALMLTVACVFASVSCQSLIIGSKGNTEDTDHGSVVGVNADAGSNAAGNVDESADESEDEENSYRIRFVFSYTAKVENSSGRLENKKSIVTVKSFFVPKDNAVVSDDLLAEMKDISYHGFTFLKWYTEWDTEEQKGVEGTEFTFDDQPLTSDITLFCDRGNLAGKNAVWSLDYQYVDTVDKNGDPITELSEVILNIEGSGAMFDFLGANEVDVPWFKNINDITKVVVSDGITSIGDNAFSSLFNLEEISIPDSIESIGIAAFQNCGAAKFVAPASLKSIGKNAFLDTSLKEVVLNDGLETIGERAFYGSNKIKTIVFPASVREIPTASFHPGTMNNKNKTHSLSKVYYLGTEEEFKSINVGMDNTWFNDKTTVYYYREALLDGEVGTYWHYAGTTNKTAVQYFYTLRYVQGDAKNFLCNIYVPVTPIIDKDGNPIYDEDGLPKLKGVITEEHIIQQKNIRYHGYHFASFAGADTLKVGLEITSDIVFTCQRNDYLSDDGGIRWTYTSGTKTLSIFVDETTKDRITADVEARVSNDGTILLTDAEKEILGVTEDRITLTDDLKEQIISGRLERSLYMWDFFDSYDASSVWTSGTEIVTIADGIKSIGRYAFAGISRTPEIVIPASVERIDPLAFEACTDLVAVYYNGTAPESILAITNDRFTVYSKVETATADVGSYWADVKENGVTKRISWILTEDGSLTIGGDDNMANFESASDTPWYGAKDKIVSVSFASNIYSIGENVINGYANVTELYIPITARIIPYSAFVGTGIVRNTDAYVNNMLVVNGHLIRVNPVGIGSNLVETYTGIVTIAEGAFNGCTELNALYVARTVKYIHPKAFKDCKINAIFADGDEGFWKVIDKNIDLPDTKIYFKHADEYITVTDENGKQVTVKTSTIDDKYWFKCGDEYVIWGCIHVWGEYIDDNNASCLKDGTKTANCTVPGCEKTDTVTIPGTMTEHVYDEENHVCTTPGCAKVDPEYTAAE